MTPHLFYKVFFYLSNILMALKSCHKSGFGGYLIKHVQIVSGNNSMNWTLQLKHYQTNDKLIPFENSCRGMVTLGMLEYHILRFPHVVNWDKMQVGSKY